MGKFARHIFICTNQREPGDPRGSCGERGGLEVAEAFKKKLHDAGQKRIVRPNKAGCLDQCAKGVCVVVYPEQVWYGHVTPADVDDIVQQHILGGKPVERLVIPNSRGSKKNRGEAMAQLDEEAKSLLRRIVERQAYRQLMVEQIRGHGLKFVPEVETQILLAQDIVHSLRIMMQIELLHAELGGADLVQSVRDKMERIPYPGSRLELAICLSLCDRAERVAAESYIDSSSEDFAAVALSILSMDRTSTRQGEELFQRFATETGNRPAAQQMFQRWLAMTIAALGRPGTPGDRRAVELRLRRQSCEESVRQYLRELRPFMDACHLVLPSEAQLGLLLPKGIAAQAGA
jgi:(2Fe-2S) ferredoxin/1,2-phenylacetyl-CoA epoxidase catalytic subunit